MNILITLGLLAAVAIGWCAGRLVPRRYEKQLEKRMEEKSEIVETHLMVTASTYLSVLQRLETGDTSGAKAELSTAIAIIYCIQKDSQCRLEKLGIVPTESGFAKMVMRLIEEDAERFEVLRMAVEKEKQGNPDSEISRIIREMYNG